MPATGEAQWTVCSVVALLALCVPGAASVVVRESSYNTFNASRTSGRTQAEIGADAGQFVAAVTPGFLAGTGHRNGQSSAWVEDGAGYSVDGSQFPGAVWSGHYVSPVPVDLDGDGDYDVVTGFYNGALKAYRNTGSTLVEDASLLAGELSTYSYYLLFPAFGDIDGDGDLDLVLGYQGGFAHFENVGTPLVPSWELRLDKRYSNILQSSGSSPFTDTIAHERFKPALIDIDGDGDLDYCGIYNYGMVYYQNTGSATNPVFTARSGADNPFNAVPMSGEGGFLMTFKDMDADGDIDVIMVDRGVVKVYPNVGSAGSPSFQGTEDITMNPFRSLVRPDGYNFNGNDAYMTIQLYPSPTALAGPGVAGGAGGSAVGDPHLQNVHGERFDLMKAGAHVLINIPRGAGAENAMLRVQADARRLSGICADMYFQELNVTGSWAEAKQVGGYHYSVSQGDVKTPEWVAFGKVDLKVVQGRTVSGLLYLNFYVKHLGRAGFAVGGLLGEDDHQDASTPPDSCAHRMSLVDGSRNAGVPSVVSVAVASFE